MVLRKLDGVLIVLPALGCCAAAHSLVFAKMSLIVSWLRSLFLTATGEAQGFVSVFYIMKPLPPLKPTCFEWSWKVLISVDRIQRNQSCIRHNTPRHTLTPKIPSKKPFLLQTVCVIILAYTLARSFYLRFSFHNLFFTHCKTLPRILSQCWFRFFGLPWCWEYLQNRFQIFAQESGKQHFLLKILHPLGL